MEIYSRDKGDATPSTTPDESHDTTLPPKNALAPNDEAYDEYPEGGLKAWSVVLGAWCAMIPSMGLLNTLAVLEAWLGEHELAAVPKTSSAWIFSCYAFFLYFCGAQVGPVFDAYDVRVVIVTGSVGMVASLLFLSFSTGTSFYLLTCPFPPRSPVHLTL